MLIPVRFAGRLLSYSNACELWLVLSRQYMTVIPCSQSFMHRIAQPFMDNNLVTGEYYINPIAYKNTNLYVYI